MRQMKINFQFLLFSTLVITWSAHAQPPSQSALLEEIQRQKIERDVLAKKCSQIDSTFDARFKKSNDEWERQQVSKLTAFNLMQYVATSLTAGQSGLNNDAPIVQAISGRLAISICHFRLIPNS
jgi:hypothetical protein